VIGATTSYYSALWNPAPERNLPLFGSRKSSGILKGGTRKRDKILKKLGVGGMGVVYKAENTALKRTVALKFLPHDLARDEEAKERFIHEAQAASVRDDPNIFNVHEISQTDDGQLFTAMAYDEGETLRRTLRATRHTCASKSFSRCALV
jgi:serine/threonine protein kinase